jgi:hypothetical protein
VVGATASVFAEWYRQLKKRVGLGERYQYRRR